MVLVKKDVKDIGQNNRIWAARPLSLI